MSETRAANNKVTISGEIVTGFEFDHEVCGENFILPKSVPDVKVSRQIL